jgi:signal peptidase II
VSARAWLFLTAALAFVADQVTKIVAVAALRDGESARFIDGALRWTLERNPGAAFGIFRRAPVLFTILAIVISIVIVVASSGARDRLHAVGLGLVLGGALGNLADRLVRAPGPFRGRVVDFIDFRVWPTFNVADSVVVVGAVLLAIASLRTERHREPARTDDAPAG